MANRLFVVVGILACSLSVLGQSNASLQGAWRVAERTTTGPNGATNTNPQPGLWIFTAKHYSIVQDTSPKPRVPRDLSLTAKPTDAEMIAGYQKLGTGDC